MFRTHRPAPLAPLPPRDIKTQRIVEAKRTAAINELMARRGPEPTARDIRDVNSNAELFKSQLSQLFRSFDDAVENRRLDLTEKKADQDCQSFTDNPASRLKAEALNIVIKNMVGNTEGLETQLGGLRTQIIQLVSTVRLAPD